MRVRGHWDEPLIRLQMSRLRSEREQDFSISVGAGEGGSDDQSQFGLATPRLPSRTATWLTRL